MFFGKNLIINIIDGSFSKGYKVFKGSFIYTNTINTSNPNRSVLVNKSLINSRKQTSSSSEASEDFLNEDELLQDMPNCSILGSLRYLDTGGVATTENSARQEKSQNISLDISKAISNFDSKLSSVEKDITPTTRLISQRFQTKSNKKITTGASSTSRVMVEPILRSSEKRVKMKLDLSSVLICPNPRNLMMPMLTATSNGIQNASIEKISPITGHVDLPLNKTTPYTTNKTLPKFNGFGIENITGITPGRSSGNYPKFLHQQNLTWNSSLNQSDNAFGSSNRVLIERDMNNLLEENESFKIVTNYIIKLLMYL